MFYIFLNVIEECLSTLVHLDYRRLCIRFQGHCVSALAPLVPMISNGIEPVYIMYLKVQACVDLVAPKWTIEVFRHHCCPINTELLCVLKMTLFLYF